MERKNTLLPLLVLAMIGSAGAAMAAEKPDLGRDEYRSNCLNCHGPLGDGNGPYASLLVQRVADLTVLAKSNGGVFPYGRVYEAIDGRGDSIKAHGSRDMPIWGRVYRQKAGEHYVDVDYNPEQYVRSRILALIEYISRLQKN